MKERRPRRGIVSYAIFLVLVVLFFMWMNDRSSLPAQSYTNAEFRQALADGIIESAQVNQNETVPTGSVYLTLKDDSQADGASGRVLYVSDVNELQKQLDQAGISYTLKDVRTKDWPTLLMVLISVIVLGLMLFMAINRAGGGGANMQASNFSKNRAKMVSSEENQIKFDNVAGLAEEKEDLEEVVHFLKEPRKYIQMGARIPKGVILVGPPGTGKTLLAKAVAGEAGVPFFTISGSDFVEMFVGVGASRVRELFADAKKNTPCIIFIDEIDAVARRRGTGMGGGHDEREQTLNQLLVEMDGFGVNEGIIVMAATNRVDILDPAILRPGRFDRKIGVGRPDVKGRREILAVHARKKPLGDDVNLDEIARTTSGFTGADLENLLNEAAIYAASADRPYIMQQDINRAFVKVAIGAEKKSRVISEKEKRITAYHESGHAILFHVLPDVSPVHSVSIIPTGLGAAGYTMPLPEADEMFNTRGRMLQDIMVCLGGRIAEEMILDDITTGASQDLKQATATAKAMVTKYGMSDAVGLISYDEDSNEVMIGRDLAHARAYGETVATTIDQEIKNIIDDCYTQARKILMDHEAILHASAALLLEKEKITGEEFEALFQSTEQKPETVQE